MFEVLVLVVWFISIMMCGDSFLGILICLEIFMLFMFGMSSAMIVFMKNQGGLLLLVVFLCMAVCEAVIGLSLLIMSSRSCSFYSHHPFSILKF